MNTTASASRPNIALWLTLSRLVLAVIFVEVFLRVPGQAGAVLALGVVLVSELTDAFDGMVARRMNMVTNLGKIVDPFADSIFRLTVFICFVKADIAPIELILLIIYRDSLIATVRILCASQNVVLAARWSGKMKAIAQAAVIIAILFLRAVFYDAPPAWLDEVNLALIALVTLITLYSGFEYVRAMAPTLKKVITDKPVAG